MIGNIKENRWFLIGNIKRFLLFKTAPGRGRSFRNQVVGLTDALIKIRSLHGKAFSLPTRTIKKTTDALIKRGSYRWWRQPTQMLEWVLLGNTF